MSEFRLNRLCSKPLTAALLKTPLTPNQITLTSLAFGIFAGTLFSRGLYGFSVAAAVSYQLAMILDNCDGEIARAKNMRSTLGGWLDVIADIGSDLALFLGVGFGMLEQKAEGPVVLFMALCLSGAVIHFLLVIVEKLKGFGPAVFEAPHPEHETRKNTALNVFDALREGDAAWFVLALALAGQAPLVLWIGGVYMQLLWVTALAVNFRWTFGKKR